MESCTFRAKSVYRSPLVFFLYRHRDWSRFALPLIALRSEILLRFQLEESRVAAEEGHPILFWPFAVCPCPTHEDTHWRHVCR